MKKALLGAIVTGLLVVSACGGGSTKAAPGGAPGGAAPTSATAPAQHGQGVAADKTAAEAASLKLSDFPAGWTSSPRSDDSSYPSVDNEVAHCLGVGVEELNHTGPSDFQSADFSDTGSDTVSSSVGYTPNAAAAVHEFSLVASPRVPGCLSPAVQKVVTYSVAHPKDPTNTLPPGATLGTSTVAVMSFPTFGDESIAYRITIPVDVGGTTVSIYLDIVTARKGRAGAELDFEAVQSPFPGDQEQHYLGLVLGRMANTS